MRGALAALSVAMLALLGGCAEEPPPASPVLDGQAAEPIRIRIPAIGVNARIGPLEVAPDGTLPPPASNDEAGWWRAGPEPGERGPAVIAGHVDSRTGPAVFHRLPQLDDGDEVLVDRADGSTAVFVVSTLERHEKEAFPTASVYGSAPGAELRLVTCGGEFDRAERSYLENVIVFAFRTG